MTLSLPPSLPLPLSPSLSLSPPQDLDAPQPYEPRLFKSHESSADIAKGGRYIYVIRDPADAFVSFHKFLPAYVNLEAGDLTATQFADAIFAGASHSGQIWEHFLGWWRMRHEPNVLWVCFEDMSADLPAVIRRVASFLKLPCAPSARPQRRHPPHALRCFLSRKLGFCFEDASVTRRLHVG